MTLEVIDDEAEPIAQRAHRIGELARDLDRDLAGDVRFARAHRLPVSKNHISLMPSLVSPCEYPISNVPGTK